MSLEYIVCWSFKAKSTLLRSCWAVVNLPTLSWAGLLLLAENKYLNPNLLHLLQRQQALTTTSHPQTGIKQEIFSANKYENATIVGIFIFISREIFKLSYF